MISSTLIEPGTSRYSGTFSCQRSHQSCPNTLAISARSRASTGATVSAMRLYCSSAAMCSSKSLGLAAPQLSVCTCGRFRQYNALNCIGESGWQRSTSLGGGAYSLPPLSLGLMMNTPMSRRAAASMHDQFRSLTKYQCRFTYSNASLSIACRMMCGGACVENPMCRTRPSSMSL